MTRAAKAKAAATTMKCIIIISKNTRQKNGG